MSSPTSRELPHWASGAIGGLAVAAVAAVLVATGAVGHKTVADELDAHGVYAADAPGVVHITSQLGDGTATGSGVVLDRAGHILTNAHVIDGAGRVSVTFEGDRAAVPATVTGRDTSSDLAVLRVDPAKAKLHPIALGDSHAVGIGDAVAAIGNPFGLDRTITTGIVSAEQRAIQAPDGFTIRNVLQTDAAINPGNSGGPLLDGHGRVIGINSQIATGGSGDGNVGVGFAIPIATVKAELPALEHGGALQRGFLGVSTAGSDAGAIVERVQAGSPASAAHLRAGEIITRVDGKAVAGADGLVQAIAGRKPGEHVKLTVLHDGIPQSVAVTLTGRPSTVSR